MTRVLLVLLVFTVLFTAVACTDPASQPGETAECTLRDCDYLPAASEADPEPEPGPFPGCCCILADGSLQVQPRHLHSMLYDEQGLATLHVPDIGVAYVTRDGTTAWMYPFDNGADYFVEGLARTVKGSKIGFVDPSLDTVIEPVWDFAFPFEDGLAIVCEGCRPVPTSEHDEHSEVLGGRWGLIDRTGQVVVEVIHTRESLPAPEDLPVAMSREAASDQGID
jgi:hypothetical protein